MASLKASIFAVLLVLCVFRANTGVYGLCENMATSTEVWNCEPCGDLYDCTYELDPANSCWTTNVPGCPLPGDATQWLCCVDCVVKNPTYTCEYYATGDASWSTSGEGSESYSYGYPQNSSLVIISSVVGVLFVIIIFSAIAAIIRRRRLHHHASSDYVVVYQQPQPTYQYQAQPYQPVPYAQPYPPSYPPPYQQPQPVRAPGTQP